MFISKRFNLKKKSEEGKDEDVCSQMGSTGRAFREYSVHSETGTPMAHKTPHETST